MADFFDRFVGSGALSSHTADSGESWGPSATSHAIDGSGSLYQTYPQAGANDYGTVSGWTPPGTDYAVSIVFGAGFRQSAVTGCGPIVRGTITDINNFKYYVASAVAGTPDLLTVACLDCVSGTVTVLYVATQNFPTQIAAGDTLTLTIAGNSTPVLTVYHNGTQIWTGTDTGGSIVTTGSAGVHIGVQSTIGSTDMVRTAWAGAIGGPTTTIAPSSVSLALNATQSFTAATAHPNEAFTWAATHGSISGSGAAETYTAPASGTSDTVTWTSIDLPLDTASAAVTLAGRSATTYYIAAAGSDSNNGTSTGTPWQTVNQVAVNGAVAGDVYKLNGGDTITGTLTLSGLVGTASAPTAVQSYGTGTPTLSPGTAKAVLISNSSYVNVVGLNIVGPGTNSNGTMTSGTARMPLVEIINTGTTAYSNIRILDCTINGGYAGIWVHSTASSSAGPINNVEIGNCTLTEFLYPAIWTSGSEASSGLVTGTPFYLSKGPLHQGLHIHDCEISYCYGGVHTGYSTGFAGQTLSGGNLASGCPDSTDDDRPINGSGVVLGNIDGGVVQFCEIHHHGLNANNTTGDGGPGNLWCYESTNMVYHVVESHHGQTNSTDGVGIDFDGGTTDSIAQFCYSHDNAGGGYFCGPITGESTANSGNTFRYCISENDGLVFGIASEAGFNAFGSVTNCTVHNCTFYAAVSGGKGAFSVQGGTSNFAINNVFVSAGTTLVTNSTSSGWTLKNNLYHNYSGSFSISWNGTSYTTLAAFQAGASQDASGVSADPLLSNLGNGGTISNLRGLSLALTAYKLGSSSPAIDAGANIASLADGAIIPPGRDFNGNPSLSGVAYDIGACEYTTVALPGGSAVFNPIGCGFIRGV